MSQQFRIILPTLAPVDAIHPAHQHPEMDTEGIETRRRRWLTQFDDKGKGAYQVDQLCTECCCGICCCAGELCNPGRQQGVYFGIWCLVIALLIAIGLLVMAIVVWIRIDDHVNGLPFPPTPPPAPPLILG